MRTPSHHTQLYTRARRNGGKVKELQTVARFVPPLCGGPRVSADRLVRVPVRLQLTSTLSCVSPPRWRPWARTARRSAATRRVFAARLRASIRGRVRSARPRIPRLDRLTPPGVDLCDSAHRQAVSAPHCGRAVSRTTAAHEETHRSPRSAQRPVSRDDRRHEDESCCQDGRACGHAAGSQPLGACLGSRSNMFLTVASLPRSCSGTERS